LRKPRTDLCDFHFKVEQIDLYNLTEKERNDFLIHNQNVIKYREIKESLLEFSEEKLCLEFDYTQNKVLPLLPNCDVFYKRCSYYFIS
jgi:hypothetical protein